MGHQGRCKSPGKAEFKGPYRNWLRVGVLGLQAGVPVASPGAGPVKQKAPAPMTRSSWDMLPWECKEEREASPVLSSAHSPPKAQVDPQEGLIQSPSMLGPQSPTSGKQGTNSVTIPPTQIPSTQEQKTGSFGGNYKKNLQAQLD